MTERVRTFIAVALPAPVRQALAQLIADLKAQSVAPVRWVDPERIHLTLKFLGDVEAPALPPLIQEVRQAVAGVGPLHLALAGTGAFPSPSRARVLWVGLEGDLGALTRLQRAVEGAVQPLGFPPEERPFTAHLTLGRLGQASPAERHSVGEALARVRVPAGLGFGVEAVTVLRSDLRPGGAVYTPLARVPLRPPQGRAHPAS